MKYCSDCGAEVQWRVPEGDNRLRSVCPSCHTIHYQNPKIVTGCIPEWDDKILLCRRAIEPRYGLWTLPAGFMENGETLQQGAARETLEEANAEVGVQQLFALFNLPHINQVYMIFRARLLQPSFGASAESLEVRLFSAAQVPWGRLAFPVIKETLALYYRDAEDGGFRMHSGDIVRVSEQPRSYRIELHA